jgi:hypothetical protein
MKTDLSLVLYKKYFKLKNRQIKIELKNHSVVFGKFVGFLKGNSSYISKWHFVESNALIGIDAFGFLVGQLINQNDILRITFMEDNAIMNF